MQNIYLETVMHFSQDFLIKKKKQFFLKVFPAAYFITAFIQLVCECVCVREKYNGCLILFCVCPASGVKALCQINWWDYNILFKYQPLFNTKKRIYFLKNCILPFWCIMPVLDRSSNTHYITHTLFLNTLSVSLYVCLVILPRLSCIFDCIQIPVPLHDILSSFISVLLLSQGSMQEDKIADRGDLQTQECDWLLSECNCPAVIV